MVANVTASVAQYERELISQRTKEALAQKKARGEPVGRPRTLPDEVVRRIASERAAGATYQAIAEQFNRERVPTAQGGQAWHPGTVRYVHLADKRNVRPEDQVHQEPRRFV